MEKVEKSIRRFTDWFMAIGAVFLVLMMLIVVANIIYRFFGGVIVGSYELVELMIVITVTAALAYAVMRKGHVVINILTSRLPDLPRSILEAFTSFLAMGTWAIVFWGAVKMLMERSMSEITEMLDIPFLPFRIIFAIGLVLMCLIYLFWSIQAIFKAVRK